MIATVSDAEIDVTLAGLLASNPRIQADTQAKLSEISKRRSENPEIEESLGYLALQQNRKDDARSHFALAVERHSKNPEVLYYYARLEQAAGAPSGKVMALLQQVLELNPRHEDARLELGFLAAESQNFQLAVDTLSVLDDVQPMHAFALFYTLSYCHIHLNHSGNARAYAEKAGGAPHSSAEQNQLNTLRLYINQEDPKPVETATTASAGR